MNLLDLDNDCLNIIGNMVKKENKKTELINKTYECIIEDMSLRNCPEWIHHETIYEDVCDDLIIVKQVEQEGYKEYVRGLRYDGYDFTYYDGDRTQLLNEIFDCADEVIERFRDNGYNLTCYDDDRTKLLNEIYKMYIYTIYEIDIEPSKKAIINKQLLDFLNHYKSDNYNDDDDDDDEDFNELIDLIDIIENTEYNFTDDVFSGDIYDVIRFLIEKSVGDK